MPSWGQILAELTPRADPATGALIPPDFDGARHKYLEQLHTLTGRSTIVYATDWLQVSGPQTSIGLGDMQGLMETFRGLPGPALDLILHSPGGQAEATDSLVRYVRSKFDDVRVIVPLAAMSAATMWALSADQILMGKHSQLGPIDPQVPIAGNYVPAGALVRQFERISRECAEDPSRLSAWLPTLQQYTPGLLEICKDADDLARSLVEEWLRTFMFKDRADGADLARKAADFFADSEVHKSHGRSIHREDARRLDLTIHDLEEDDALQDAVLSVHHAVLITLQSTSAVKLVENHLGAKVVGHQHQMMISPAMGGPVPMPMPMPMPQPPGSIL